MPEETPYRIGDLARAVDVNVETVRYYQRIRLLPLPTRFYGTQRRYDTMYLNRLRSICRARELGFTLKEIRELLSLDNNHCQDVQQLAKIKYEQIESKRKDLARISHKLEKLLAACKDGSVTPGHCAVLHALADPPTAKKH